MTRPAIRRAPSPALGSRWSILAGGGKVQPVVFQVVGIQRKTRGPAWYQLEVVSDDREDAHQPGFRFDVEAAWFDVRGVLLD